jgi:membrane protein YdbS with pleckstrin-like domain
LAGVSLRPGKIHFSPGDYDGGSAANNATREEQAVSYLDRVLQPEERVLVRGYLHWVIYLPSLMLQAVAIALAAWARLSLTGHPLAMVVYAGAGLLLLLGISAFLGRMVVRLTTEFAVTDHRVIVKRGFMSLHTVEMNLDKVESVDVDQTILGRILGYGAVTIHGVGARWDPIPRIADPLKFRNAITTRASGPGAS